MVLALSGWGVACATAPTTPQASGAAMWVHYDAANRLQLSMVRGDLTGAREAARRIESIQAPAGLSPGSEDAVEAVRREAHAVRTSTGYRQAAEAAARMAALCGGCHEDAGLGPAMTDAGSGAFRTPLSAQPLRRIGHMADHVWAGDRMWEGLLAPSDARWRAGARRLVERPVPEEIFPPYLVHISERLVELAREAMDTEAADDRSRLYAEILQTCSSCHQEVGIGQGP